MTMLSRSNWDEFRESGLLWWINRTLHLFGWAITVIVDEDDKVTDVYPARCSFRGFSPDSEDRGFHKLTKHLKNNIEKLTNDLEK